MGFKGIVRFSSILFSASRALIRAMALAILVLVRAEAQELEPRQYSNLPVGLNFIAIGYGYADGGIATDPSSPLQNADIKIDSALIGYARSLDLFGMSGKIDAFMASACLSGSADVAGMSRERDVCGITDPRVRLTMNFYGAPALSLKEFAGYTQDLVLGGSLQVGLPLGQYDSEKLVNIGTHRWLFKPEIGGSKKVGPVTLELASAVTFFTDNDRYFGDREREQDPIYSVQMHIVYPFKSGIWAALNGTYYRGGKSTLDGIQGDDLLVNERVGLTLGFPVNRYNSIKVNASTGLYTRTGSDFDTIAVAWQYRWGAGL